jgi:hypothetical protein
MILLIKLMINFLNIIVTIALIVYHNINKQIYVNEMKYYLYKLELILSFIKK